MSSRRTELLQSSSMVNSPPEPVSEILADPASNTALLNTCLAIKLQTYERSKRIHVASTSPCWKAHPLSVVNEVEFSHAKPNVQNPYH